MHRTCLKVASCALSILVFLMRRLAKMSLVFWDISDLPCFETFCCIVIFFVAVETKDMTQVLMSHAGNARGSSWRCQTEDAEDLSQDNHGSISKIFTSWATLFYVSNERSIEPINITFIIYLWIRQSFANFLSGDLDPLLSSLYHWFSYFS